MGYDVRPAEPTDLPVLTEIERAGDQMFIDLFQPDEWGDPTPGEERAAVAGFLLVAGSPPVGFAHVLEEDGAAHLQELVVPPSHGLRGIGTALLEAACAEAAGRGYAELTLTTYSQVPWNAPYYLARGFSVIEEPSGRIAEHLEAERALEEFGPRVAMTRPLSGPAADQ